MTAEQAFTEMVKALMKTMSGFNIGCRVILGTVKDVNEKECTCTVERDGSPEMHDVRLNAVIDEKITDCFTVFPAVGGYVLVLSLGEATEGFIIATSKIDKVVVKTGDITINMSNGGIVMNGGELGGLIDIEKLTGKVNGLVDAFNSHTHTIPTGTINTAGSATNQSSSAPVTVPAIQSKAEKLSRGDYENDKVKHG